MSLSTVPSLGSQCVEPVPGPASGAPPSAEAILENFLP